MSSTFGTSYSEAYDPLYSDKNYDSECELIDGLFRRYGVGSISSVLDLGSGTGNHAFRMSRLGYDVVGVERSESMLSVAKAKLQTTADARNPLFHSGDIRLLRLGRQFDAALMMFAVLGYQIENSDVLGALRTARQHLKVGGLFVLDVWYGPAVIHQGPSQRVKVIPNRDGQLLRVATSELDIPHQQCRVAYRMWSISGGKSVRQTEETHTMRFFFPMELRFFMECAGFEFIRLGGFPDVDRDASVETWNVVAVARAV